MQALAIMGDTMHAARHRFSGAGQGQASIVQLFPRWGRRPAGGGGRSGDGRRLDGDDGGCEGSGVKTAGGSSSDSSRTLHRVVLDRQVRN